MVEGINQEIAKIEDGLESCKGLLAMIETRLVGIPEDTVKTVGYGYITRNLERVLELLKAQRYEEARDILAGLERYTLGVSDLFNTLFDGREASRA